MRYAAPAVGIAVTIAASLLLGGCVSRLPNDVALSSVEAVDSFERAELGPVLDNKRSHGLLLLVSFATATNLLRFAQEEAITVASIAYFCDQPQEQVALSYVFVFADGIQVDDRGPSPARFERNTTDPPDTYYFFINVQDAGSISSHPTGPDVFHAFDLLRQPRDICFNIRGHIDVLSNYKSNPVRIPKDVINGALRDLPPAFR